MRSLLLVLPFVCYVACTGDAPQLDGDAPPNGNDGGGEGGNPPPTQEDGGPVRNSVLTLEGQPLVLTAGTDGTLQFKVTSAPSSGEVTFTVSGLPEGVSGSNAVTLAAGAQTLNVKLTSVASAKHGDYTVTVIADGGAATATARLVVRGTPGIADTSFGTGGSQMIGGSAATRVIGLANDSVVVGGTVSSKPTFLLIDGAGTLGSVKTVTSSVGTALVDLAPTADGGFVALVSAPSELRLVWFSSAASELMPNVLVSTATTPVAKIAATPVGTLFAQAKTNAAVTVDRYGVGAVDGTFATATINGNGYASLKVLGGNSDGSAWISMGNGMGQEGAFATNNVGVVQNGKNYILQENCAVGGAAAGDMLVRCSTDEPAVRIRRLQVLDGTVQADSSFGTNGALNYGSTASVQSIFGFGADKFYIATVQAKVVRTTAYAANGDVRAVFGTSGYIEGTGDDAPAVGIDARGRLLYATPIQTTQSNVKISRFWD